MEHSLEIGFIVITHPPHRWRVPEREFMVVGAPSELYFNTTVILGLEGVTGWYMPILRTIQNQELSVFGRHEEKLRELILLPAILYVRTPIKLWVRRIARRLVAWQL
jgi:hypothetical protein